MENTNIISKDIEIRKDTTGIVTLSVLSTLTPLNFTITKDYSETKKDSEELNTLGYFSSALSQQEITEYYCKSILNLETVLDMEPKFTVDKPIEVIADIQAMDLDSSELPKNHNHIDLGVSDDDDEESVETIYIGYKLNVEDKEDIPDNLTEILGELTKLLLILSPEKLGI